MQKLLWKRTGRKKNMKIVHEKNNWPTTENTNPFRLGGEYPQRLTAGGSIQNRESFQASGIHV